MASTFNEEEQRRINNLVPTTNQLVVINSVSVMVSALLRFWPVASGKTTARKMIALRILLDDRD